MPRDVTYDRPVKAKLMVELENGEKWEASAKDLRNFNYVDVTTTYGNFRDTLAKALFEAGLIERERDLTLAELNPLRYLVETAIMYPQLLPELAKRSVEEEPSIIEKIVQIERHLQAHPADN